MEVTGQFHAPAAALEGWRVFGML